MERARAFKMQHLVFLEDVLWNQGVCQVCQGALHKAGARTLLDLRLEAQMVSTGVTWLEIYWFMPLAFGPLREVEFGISWLHNQQFIVPFKEGEKLHEKERQPGSSQLLFCMQWGVNI